MGLGGAGKWGEMGEIGGKQGKGGAILWVMWKVGDGLMMMMRNPPKAMFHGHVVAPFPPNFPIPPHFSWFPIFFGNLRSGPGRIFARCAMVVWSNTRQYNVPGVKVICTHLVVCQHNR